MVQGAAHPAIIRKDVFSRVLATSRMRISECRQLALYERLLRRIVGAGPRQETSQSDVTRALGDLQRSRRDFRTADGRPRVVGFGTDDDWRRHGVWTAMKEESDFELYEVPDEPRYSRDDETDRTLKGSALLEFLDTSQRQGVTAVFFAHSGWHISSTLLEALHGRGIWTIAMSVDDKHQFSRPIDPTTGEPHQLRLARGVDLYWTSWDGALSFLSSLGVNAWFAPPGANPAVHRPLQLPRGLDVVFVGARYGIRELMVRYLRRVGLRVAAFGPGWPEGMVPYEEMVTIFNRAKVVLGVSGVGATDRVQHLKGRDFEVPMCGAAYVTSYNPELSQAFRIGEEIVCYASKEQCAEEICRLLADPERAEALRVAARRRSAAEHSWHHRVRALWDLFDGEVG